MADRRNEGDKIRHKNHTFKNLFEYILNRFFLFNEDERQDHQYARSL